MTPPPEDTPQVPDGTWVERLDAELEPGTEFLSDRPTRTLTESVIGEGPMRWGLVTAKAAAAHIAEVLPAFASEAGAFELLNRAVESTTLATLRALATDDVDALAPTTEPTDATRSYVRRNIPLDEVIRGIHLSQETITSSVLEALTHVVEPQEIAAESRRSTEILFRCFGLFAAQIAELYGAEHAQWVRSQTAIRSELIDRVLDPDVRLDLTRVGTALGFDLDGASVAVVLWYDDPHPVLGTEELLEHAYHRMLTRAGAREGLACSVGPTTLHVWLHASAEAVADAAQEVAVGLVRAALGGTARDGVEGFREGHRAAKATERVMRLAGGTLGPVVTHQDVELISYLSKDLAGLRRYVRRILGDLAETGERNSQLRETLWVYLENERKVATVANLLHTHRNTVSYRVNLAREALPDSVDLGSYELRVALSAVHLLGEDALLATPSTGRRR